MKSLLDELYDFIVCSDDYNFLPESRRRYRLESRVAELDDESRDFIYELMSEWERYGFRNGFAYAMKIFMECHI